MNTLNRKYELVLILEEALQTKEQVIERLENALTSSQATIAKKEEWGAKDFAYEINKKTRGEYFFYSLESSNSDFSIEFDRLTKITDGVVRYLLVRV